MRSPESDPVQPGSGAAAMSPATHGSPETLETVGHDDAPGLWRRAALIFVSPGRAWEGLRERAAWWFPLLLIVVVSSLAMLATYDRAYLPMMTEGVERQVASGQMTQQQLDRTEAFFGSAKGKAMNLGFQFLGIALITLLTALVIWLGGAFILGREGFGYRHALEVGSWS